MKSGYLVTGIRFRSLIKLMTRNRFSVLPPYCFRFLFLLQNALWASFFTRRDRIIWGDYFRKHPLPKDPVIIVGHWRTGSTWLHQLMNLDEQLSAPTLYQTSMPESFITARPYFAPIMTKLIGKFRPFDNVRTGIDEPQEDEFALFRMTCDSPLEQLMFPKDPTYFLLQPGCSFNKAGKTQEKWVAAMMEFYRKISWFNKKRLLLKNPFHSMRIAVLKELFPDARFIHIFRNPLEVVPSTIRMWSVVGSQNVMNSHFKAPSVEEVSKFYAIMLSEIEAQFNQLAPGTFTSIKYEDLLQDPVATLKRSYANIGLEFTTVFEQKLIEHLDLNRNFEKNNYKLEEETRSSISVQLHDFMQKHSYLTANVNNSNQ
jgi:hypothetical protein